VIDRHERNHPPMTGTCADRVASVPGAGTGVSRERALDESAVVVEVAAAAPARENAVG
jgi:hypothetical protein